MIRLRKCKDCRKVIKDGDDVVHFDCYKRLLEIINDLETRIDNPVRYIEGEL